MFSFLFSFLGVPVIGHRRWAVVVLTSLFLWLTPPRTAGSAPEKEVNACGCGRDTTGSCFCQKVARCGCPGECEPKGCEEKRAKQLEREILAETKRASDDDRRRNAAHASQAASQATATSGDPSEEPVRAKPARFESASAAARPPKTTAAKKMTTSQKKELGHLLEAYLAENPERRSRTVEQLRSELE